MATKIELEAGVSGVVVSINLESYLASTLELAIALAIASRCGLHGLFVEDVDLLSAASLPFTREVSLLSAQPQALDYQQMLTSFNARSRLFRRSLVHQAEQSSLLWSYHTARGRKHHTALEHSTGAEYLVIGESEKSPARKLRSRRIMVIKNNNHRLWQALDVVLNEFRDNPVEVIMVSSAQQAEAEVERQVVEKLSSHPHSRMVEIDRAELEIALTTQALIIDCLISCRHEAQIIEQIIRHNKCSAIVVA